MFNIGMGELFFIVVILLVVLGPERLPKVMREIGKYAYQLRMIVNELTDQFAEELRPIQELQQLADDLNPVKQVTKVSMNLAEPPQKKASNSQAGEGSKLIKPAKDKPAVKPTAAFHSPPPRRTSNPMKVISRAKSASSGPRSDASASESDS